MPPDESGFSGADNLDNRFNRESERPWVVGQCILPAQFQLFLRDHPASGQVGSAVPLQPCAAVSEFKAASQDDNDAG